MHLFSHRQRQPRQARGDDPRAPSVAVTVPVAPGDVFDVLADGWLYALWVVGASHIHDVDDTWPSVGARIHHGVGPWPTTLHDVTEVLAVDPPHSLELRARSWPVGSAWIRIALQPGADGSTAIQMSERVSGGPGRLLPDAAQKLLLTPRNNESLKRLADIVVGRADADRQTHG